MDPEPDLEIAVSVRADEVRLERKPEIRIGAFSNVPATAESVSERENVPDELEPGTTYGKAAVRWHLAARLTPTDQSRRETHGDVEQPPRE